MAHVKTRVGPWSRVQRLAGHRLFQAFVALLSLRFLGLALSTVAVALLARSLGPSAYGALAAGIAVVAIFTSMTDLGLSRAVVGSYPGIDNPDRLQASRQLLGAGMAVAPFAAVAFLVSELLPSSNQPAVTTWVGIGGAIAICAECCSTAYAADQLGRSRLKPDGWADVAVRALNLITSLGAITGLLPLRAVAFLYGVAPVLRIATLMALNGAPMLRPSLPGRLLLGVLRTGLPLSLAAVLGLILARLDQVVVYRVTGSAAAGYYAGAYRLLLLFMVPVSMLSQVLFADRAAAAGESVSPNARKLPLAVGAVVAGGVLVVVLLAPYLIRVLIGSRYLASVEILRILAFSAIPTAVNFAVAARLSAEARNGRILASTAVGLGSNAALLAVLVPLHGAMGAAIALVLSESVAMAFLLLTA